MYTFYVSKFEQIYIFLELQRSTKKHHSIYVLWIYCIYFE